jgi:hypothetical protein
MHRANNVAPPGDLASRLAVSAPHARLFELSNRTHVYNITAPRFPGLFYHLCFQIKRAVMSLGCQKNPKDHTTLS